MSRVHGGPDRHGPATWDFSTNANACGPCPQALEAVRAADPAHYPDPAYHALRHKLAHWHGVDPARLVFAASASEFIMRITAVSGRGAPGAVEVPRHAYGDYEAAALAHGRSVLHPADTGRRATLRWCCDPSSPLGADAPPDLLSTGSCHAALTVLDRAYAPLRLDGECGWAPDHLDAVFQLFSPNKALGLTGVRGAYAIAPPGAQAWVNRLEAVAPSWPLGAHALAMLDAWPEPGVQHWLACSRDTLREWKRAQLAWFAESGFEVRPSVANFFCVRWPPDLPLSVLRHRGVALRDCRSFGLPGWVRVSVQPPVAQRALREAVAAHRPGVP